MKKASAISSHVVITDFGQRHGLAITDVVRRESIAIKCSWKAHIAVNQGYAALNDDALGDSGVGLLLNMLDRNFEHVEAAVVAFVTGSGSAAEVIARTSTESSINILYILAGDRVRRLQAYFEHYLNDVDRQVAKWRKEQTTLSSQAVAMHSRGAEN